jgi:hypothetical protein
MSLNFDRVKNVLSISFSNNLLKEELHSIEMGNRNIRLGQNITLISSTVPTAENRPSETPSEITPADYLQKDSGVQYQPFVPK